MGMKTKTTKPPVQTANDQPDVPPGYKRTEVGVIPEDWEVKALASIGQLLSGAGFPVHYQGLGSGDYPFFKVSDMNTPGNELFMRQANHYISEDVRKTLNATLIPRDSIVFAKIGAAVFLERKRLLLQDSCIDNNMMAFRPTDEDVSLRFLYFVMLQLRFSDLVATTALPSLSSREIGGVKVAMPPLPEQRAIAEALSDVDGLLAALDKLIAKKRAIKQAAMQQLLTGQSRLPGFSGEWETKRVFELGEIVTGGTPKTSIAKYWGGKYPWVTPTDISTSRDMFTSERLLTLEGLEAIRSLPPNSVLVTCIASIGKNAILKVRGACNQQINAIIPNQSNNSVFLYYMFEANKPFLLANAGTTATSIISKAAFSELSFSVPSHDEQAAIATVLSDMDAEIAALERRRDKTKQIKHGMMQQLLTGRVRLVDVEEKK